MPSSHIIVTGISHHTTPLATRSKYAWDDATQKAMIHRLKLVKDITQFFILATCNRTEIICATHNQSEILKSRLNHFIPEASTYQYTDITAIQHILRTLSGLDSMIIGETEILGQFRTAIKKIHHPSTEQKTLLSIMQKLMNTAKHIRLISKLQTHKVNISDLVIKNIHSMIKTPENCRFLCIGAGTVIQQHIPALNRISKKPITVVSRSSKQHKSFNQTTFVQLKSTSQLEKLIEQHDCIISATSAPHHIITQKMLSQINIQDKLFIDLAVPCDIEPDPNNIALKRIHLDELRNTNISRTQVQSAEQKCQQLTNQCFEQFHLDQSTDSIKTFRSQWFHDAQVIRKQPDQEKLLTFTRLRAHMQTMCKKNNISTELPEIPCSVEKYCIETYVKQLAHIPTLAIKAKIRALYQQKTKHHALDQNKYA